MDGVRFGKGYVFNRRYVVERCMGQGGFGITYAVRDRNDGQRYAVKEYFPDFMAIRYSNGKVGPRERSQAAMFKKYRNEFRNEAEALTAFKHPNIVKVMSRFDQNETSCFVMEFIEGMSLTQALGQHSLSNEDALLLAEGLVEGMKTVHDRGMLHRDIKPSNILLGPRTRKNRTNLSVSNQALERFAAPILIDFGAVRWIGHGAGDMTGIATPGFGAPEASRERGLQDVRSDIYGLCATLYTALDGKPPPSAPDREKGATLEPAEHRFNGRAPAPFLRTIDRGLDLNPDRRPANARDLRTALFQSVLRHSRTPSTGQAGVEPTANRAAIAPSSISSTGKTLGPMRSEMVVPKTLQVGRRELLQVLVHDGGNDTAGGQLKRRELNLVLSASGAECRPDRFTGSLSGGTVEFRADIDPLPQTSTAQFFARLTVDHAELGWIAASCPIKSSGRAGGVSKSALTAHRRVYLAASKQDGPLVGQVRDTYRSLGIEVAEADTSVLQRCTLFHLCWSRNAAADLSVERDILAVVSKASSTPQRGHVLVQFQNLEQDAFARPSPKVDASGLFQMI